MLHKARHTANRSRPGFAQVRPSDDEGDRAEPGARRAGFRLAELYRPSARIDLDIIETVRRRQRPLRGDHGRTALVIHGISLHGLERRHAGPVRNPGIAPPDDLSVGGGHKTGDDEQECKPAHGGVPSLSRP